MAEVRRALRLGDLLVQEGVLSPDQLSNLLQQQRSSGKQLGRLLVEGNYLSEQQLLGYLSKAQGIPQIDLKADGAVDIQAVPILEERLAKRFGVLCVGQNDNTLIVAMSNPQDVIAIDNIKMATGMDVKPVLALRKQIEEAIEVAYAQLVNLDQMAADMEAADVETFADDTTSGSDDSEADAAPVVRYVNSILFEAVKARASDIHIEPFEQDVTVRFRVDGKLRAYPPPSKRMVNAVVSRIKIISNLDIAERRLPQDGRSKVRIAGKSIDIRVSTLPCLHGEKIVMRILDKSATSMELDKLGMDAVTLKEMKRVLEYPHGVILLSGPTGAGKTTTLYSFLKYIDKPDVNIVTIEDPVEYQLHGVNQVHVKSAIGMTFASGLRSILRQDPDVIMVGELRDKETLEVAVRAALTGHLVFSTIHTNSAVSTFTRMVDMGVEPFLVASSVVCVISQRLIRKVCAKCKEEYEVPPELRPGLEKRFGVEVNFPLVRGVGCSDCGGTGYRGRAAVHEYVTMDGTIREMIVARKPEAEIAEYCAKKKMRNLKTSTFLRLYDGYTSPEEAMSLFYEDD